MDYSTNLNVEKELIGALLNNPEKIGDIATFPAEMFSVESNRKLYNLIIRMYEDNDPIDVITVFSKAQKEKISLTAKDFIGWEGYGSKTKEYARILYEIYLEKRIKEIPELYQSETDIFEKIDKIITRLSDLTTKVFTHIIKPFGEVLKDTIKTISEGQMGVKTGFYELDDTLGCLYNTDLIIVAARPSMGKTAFALNIAKEISKKDEVLFFSLEMSDKQLASRIISSETGVSNKDMYLNKKVPMFPSWITSLKLNIDDTSAIHINEIRSKAQKIAYEKGIKLMIVDYIQLARATAESREKEISAISAGLKSIAKDLNIPVIALSQLNRNCELRADKRPMLADLRESGSIEQDADVVMFLYRPEFYGIKVVNDGESSENYAEVIISKNRKGETKIVPMIFDKIRTQFKNKSLYDNRDKYYEEREIF